MSMGHACTCGHRECWYVATYKGNHSAFNGYRFTPSAYSEIVCDRYRGGCGARWRTKAKYVEEIVATAIEEGLSFTRTGMNLPPGV